MPRFLPIYILHCIVCIRRVHAIIGAVQVQVLRLTNFKNHSSHRCQRMKNINSDDYEVIDSFKVVSNFRVPYSTSNAKKIPVWYGLTGTGTSYVRRQGQKFKTQDEPDNENCIGAKNRKKQRFEGRRRKSEGVVESATRQACGIYCTRSAVVSFRGEVSVVVLP
jgi:hypothetical protein